jgi:hypothetical protein
VELGSAMAIPRGPLLTVLTPPRRPVHSRSHPCFPQDPEFQEDQAALHGLSRAQRARASNPGFVTYHLTTTIRLRECSCGHDPCVSYPWPRLTYVVIMLAVVSFVVTAVTGHSLLATGLYELGVLVVAVVLVAVVVALARRRQ